MAALDLKEPNKEYLEFEDQPENNIPYTPKEESAIVYNIPIEKSVIAKPWPNGIIPHKDATN